jgi:preprotein translocase subunit SecG
MPIIILILIFLTLATLILGIILMAKGGKINKKYSNKLMAARVALQFLAIIMLAFIYFFVKK